MKPPTEQLDTPDYFDALADTPWGRDFLRGEDERMIYAKPVVCETSVGYAIHAEDGRFLAFVSSLGDALIAAHEENVALFLVH